MKFLILIKKYKIKVLINFKIIGKNKNLTNYFIKFADKGLNF